jgi:hypothetical protein
MGLGLAIAKLIQAHRGKFGRASIKGQHFYIFAYGPS